MEKLINSVRQSLNNKNWYAALTLTLTLPDICGKLEYPDVNSSRKRYASWFDNYVLKFYTGYFGPEKEKHIFLSGNDCYALRCSYLHQGEDDITEQQARENLNKFMFIEPPSWGSAHCNQKTNIDGYSVLQLQVDIFCLDICNAAELWIKNYIDKDSKNELKLNSLFKIHNVTNGLPF